MKVQGFARSFIAIAIGSTINSSVIANDVIDQGMTFSIGGSYNYLHDERNLDNQLAPEIGLGYRFDDRWSLAGIYSSSTTERKGGGDTDQRDIRLDAFYDITPWDGSLTPYVVAGIGDFETQLKGASSHNDTRLNLGLGLRTAITPNLSLGGDVRAIRSLDNSQTESMLNLALTWTFGRTSQPEPVQEQEVMPVSAPEPPRDSDNDGVIDAEDLCPGTEPGAKVDETGCVPMAEIDLLVNFAFDSDAIDHSAFPMIEKMGKFLQRYPEVRIRVEGHSDSQGPAKYNQELSQRRAEAIRKALIDQYKVDASRIEAVGKGESEPVASNDTDQGRQQNRRVITEIIQN